MILATPPAYASDMCLAAEAHGDGATISEAYVVLSSGRSEQAEGSGSSPSLSIVVRRPAAPHAWIRTEAACWGGDGLDALLARPGASVGCQIDCDGGSAVLTANEDGTVHAELSFFAVEVGLSSALFPPPDPDDGAAIPPIGLTGTVTLRAAPAALCEASFDRAYAGAIPPTTELRTGDVSPLVVDLERALVALRRGAMRPNEVFDNATDEALRLHQRLEGIPETGVADGALLRSIASSASVAGGC